MFKIWDKVRIKSREQMEKEFGLDKNWDINNYEPSFITTMEHLCWRTAEIRRIDWIIIGLMNRSNDYFTSYGFTTDMIEPIEENKTEQERTPTQWEYVEVSDDDGWRYKRIYLFTNNNNVHYYVCAWYELDYNNWNPFTCVQTIDIRPIQTK